MLPHLYIVYVCIFFISPFIVSLNGMNNFRLEAFPLSAGKSRFQATNLQKFGLVGKILVLRWFLFFTIVWDCGLLYSRERLKMYNSDHDGVGELSICPDSDP
jgi:hypothetical protein